MKTARYLACLLGLSLFVVACGDTDGGQPSAGISNLMAYAPLTGAIEIETVADMPAGVQKVELFVAGVAEPVAVAKKAPYKLTWDTTSVADGLHRIALRVTARDDKTENGELMSVVVLNNGVLADVFDFEENAGYVLEIPTNYDGSQEVDAPHHWLNPAGVKTILAISGWTVQPDQTPWNIGLTVGKGICPHRGVQYGDEVYSAESPTVLSVLASDENSSWTTFPETIDPNDAATQWYFVHLRPEMANRAEHLGQAVPYWIKVFLLQ